MAAAAQGKATQGSQLGGVKAAKYYGAQGVSGAGQSKVKKQVQSMKQADAYDQMITPRNVNTEIIE